MEKDLASYQIFISGQVDGIINNYSSIKNVRNRNRVIQITNEVGTKEQVEEIVK